MYIKRVSIKNFRTLLDFEIELDEKLQIIAGANNSGKSNLLRALNIFFNEGFDEDSSYDKSKDLSYHIEKGTGSASPTTIEVDLLLQNDEISKIKDLDSFATESNIIRTKGYYSGELEGWYHSNKDGNFPRISDLKKGKNKIAKKTHPVSKLFNRIQFVYVPTQFNVSDKIKQLVAEEILPTMIDSYGNTGLSNKVKELKDKINEVDELTKEVLFEKNKLISQNFRDVINKFPEIQAGIDLDKYALEVSLIGENLAEILSKRITLNVQDASHKEVDSKGSGIQKLVLITLLEYFSKNVEEKARYTNPFLIWAIDEPETFMQPKLQKQVREIFNDISNSHQIVYTTHSPKMINIYEPKNVKLFYLESESFTVARRGGKTMFKKMTKIKQSSDIGFIEELKEHFGVEPNDGWILRDKNILFEGNDDVLYFHSTFKFVMGHSLDVSNVVSSSSENMPNFVELLHQQISNKELLANSIICLLDNDDAGRKAFDKINKYKNHNAKSKKYIKVFKTISMYLEENEDGSINYPSMIEDLIIPEIFYSAMESFLLNKYKNKANEIRNDYSFENFYESRKSSKRTPILEVADNYFDTIIQNDDRFTFTSLSVKYAIANIYHQKINNLDSETTQKYRTKYQKLKSFFKEFI
jgi:predicted ATP-dependent endonuclease of OLD family